MSAPPTLPQPHEDRLHYVVVAPEGNVYSRGVRRLAPQLPNRPDDIWPVLVQAQSGPIGHEISPLLMRWADANPNPGSRLALVEAWRDYSTDEIQDVLAYLGTALYIVCEGGTASGIFVDRGYVETIMRISTNTGAVSTFIASTFNVALEIYLRRGREIYHLPYRVFHFGIFGPIPNPSISNITPCRQQTPLPLYDSIVQMPSVPSSPSRVPERTHSGGIILPSEQRHIRHQSMPDIERPRTPPQTRTLGESHVRQQSTPNIELLPTPPESISRDETDVCISHIYPEIPPDLRISLRSIANITVRRHIAQRSVPDSRISPPSSTSNSRDERRPAQSVSSAELQNSNTEPHNVTLRRATSTLRRLTQQRSITDAPILQTVPLPPDAPLSSNDNDQLSVSTSSESSLSDDTDSSAVSDISTNSNRTKISPHLQRVCTAIHSLNPQLCSGQVQEILQELDACLRFADFVVAASGYLSEVECEVIWDVAERKELSIN